MSIELLNMDCMEYMATQPANTFDLAIVDPPYGGNDAIGMKDCKDKTKQAATRTDYKLFENIAPATEYFSELMRVSKNQIIWGCNFYKDVDLTGGRIVWDKLGTAFGRAELAYYSNSKSVQIYQYEWNGMIQGDMKNKEHRIHPTQKPVKLYDWLLSNYSDPSHKILDTHLGSGSSAIAAHYFGCDFVGCEIDKDYYEAAKARLDSETRQTAMF